MLITIEDLRLIRPITQNVSDLNSIEPYIEEAEQADLKNLLGAELYYDLVKNKNDGKYSDFLNGKEYQNSKGNTLAFAGLKKTLAYFAYARLILNDNLKHTNSGMVFKRNEYSEQPSSKSIADKAQNAKAMAMNFWQDCEAFLNHNKSVYSLWKSDCFQHNSGISSRATISGVNNRRFK